MADSCQERSCEVTAFQRYFYRLKTGLQNNLYDITPRLFAKELISEDDQTNILCDGIPPNKGAFNLVNSLLRRIRRDPPSFYRILAELDCPDYSDLATGLKEELKRVQEEAAEQPRLDPPTCAPVSLCG